MNLNQPMTHDRWVSLTDRERAALRTPPVPECLAPFKGMRVEATDSFGERRRFWVGVSTGWAPAFLEIKTSRSRGGTACDREYSNIQVVNHGPR